MCARVLTWLRAALALLLAMSRQTSCQDENEFYYSPVERSFAQVQPPLYPNTRPPSSYLEPGGYRPGASPEYLTALPSPNYNQNPSPFQLPTGRSQSPGQYYLNQADLTSGHKSRFRQAPPTHYQLVPSTYRPDAAHIHSAAYQHDPSRPETFLGQITLHNPDTDFLRGNSFRNSQFDGNSLRNNFQLKGSAVEQGSEIPNDDLFGNNRVTTYNPNRFSNRPRQEVKPPRGRVNYYTQLEDTLNNQSNFEHSSKPATNRPTSVPQTAIRGVQDKATTISPSDHILYNYKSTRTGLSRQPAPTTDYKQLYELEPLLEDDIGDASYRELMKNNQRGSNYVEVIKSGTSRPAELTVLDSDKYDSNPSASSMNTDTKGMAVNLDNTGITTNVEEQKKTNEKQNNVTDIEKVSQNTSTSTKVTNESKEEKEQDTNNEDLEYYYDDLEATAEPLNNTGHTAEDEEDYEAEGMSKETEIKTPNSFDVLTLKANHTMVKDDNFKEFVDSTYMDPNDSIESTEAYTDSSSEEIQQSTTDTSTILRQEVVSVVTTKSVVNGTISVPDVTFPPLSTKHILPEVSTESSKSAMNLTNGTSTPNTTENYVVVASVQTSRSVSGARFLPFPTVEQDEKKQVLTEQEADLASDEFAVTKNPRDDIDKSAISSKDSSSTESINDKLDSIQSELSSAVLSGNFQNNDKHISVITESTTEKIQTTTASTPLQLFTLKSITTSSTTEKSAPEPLPVMIKKFSPHQRSTTSTTTEKPKRKPSYVTVKVDDLSGLLPSGYKPRTSFKDRKKISTTSTTEMVPLIDESINSTQGRSSGITNQNKINIQSDTISALLPNDYKQQTKDQSKIADDIIQTFKSEDINKFLPPGFQLKNNDTVEKPAKINITNVLDKVPAIDISAFLPKDYKKSSTTTSRPKSITKFTTVADKVDISAFLPKGFKLDKSDDKEKEVIKKIQLADVSNLLPPGYNSSKNTDTDLSTHKDDKDATSETTLPNTTSKPASGGFKVVFPSRPGSKPARKTTSPKPIGGQGPGTLLPTIQKGWPTRASTEFTGWPTPSTTPFSIEKLLEAQRNATATSAAPELSTVASTRRPTTTTTTTPAPPPPTTPGVCRHDCDIAATIKIVGGVQWVPELLDHHTDEWKQLAKEVQEELNSVYSKSDLLKKWFKGVRIDAFSKGSVLVDYFVELNEVSDRLDTLELKQRFHKSLRQARPGSVVERLPDTEFDPDAMVGDQPEEERASKSDEKMTKTIDKSAGKLEVGKFVVDPTYTEFIVLPKRHEPAVGKAEDEALLPQWGIAVIVIALASLLFVVIFGVTVLVNRQKSAKAKQPIPLSEDMLRELDKSHMGGYDDLHLKERELPYPPSKQRRLSTTFAEQLAYPGAAGDSWRSEWTPQLQQYMQHYTPDSGRGSQLYGAAGYGYGGSQLYGQSGGGGGAGSQLYGYTGAGEYPPHARSQYARRRSDYDRNF